MLANAVKVDTLDPAQNSVNESISLTQNIYSRLVQPNATGTALLPDLATSWKVSNGGKTYTFKLRSAKFSDGTPLTAQDAAFSIQRSRSFLLVRIIVWNRSMSVRASTRSGTPLSTAATRTKSALVR